MKATIVTIGDEILIGQIVDTNSSFIAQRLSSVGFVVESKLSIGDSAGQIRESLTRAMERTSLVIVTGGLGPTKDDITKHTIAEMFGCGMRHEERVAQHVEHLLAVRGVAYNSLNQGQAMVPECCEVLFNEHGTAPGMLFERDGAMLISLPGVPFEMKALMDDLVIPALKSRFSLRESVHRTLITSGLPESILAERIEAWEDALPKEIKLAYLPGPGRVRLRLSAYDVEDVEAVRRDIEARFAELQSIIPGYILGFDKASMEGMIHDLLLASGETLAIAESCTGGALTSKFTEMAGASSYLLAGLVTYSNESKVNILGVDPTLIEKHGAVSEQVAQAMAEGVRRVTGADYAIATTGIAGPTGGSEEKPIGTVWFGVATAQGSFAVLKPCGTERSQVIWRAVAEALSLLYKSIIKPQ